MINVALIGAGIGREHLDAYRALPDEYRVTIVCDLDTERAAEIIGDDPIRITATLADVMEDHGVDLVDVCLPPHLHFEVSSQALNAGKHVICEKPMVTSLSEADRLLAVANASAGKLYPVFQYRYGRAMAQLKALSAAGLTGKPFAASLETHWSRGPDYYAVPWRGTWAGENGGAVLGHAIHNHDLITHLMGAPRRVAAFVDTRVNDIETEDCASISIQTETGAMVTSSITLGAATDTTRMRLCFEGLTATSGEAPYAPMAQPWSFMATDPQKQSQVDDAAAAVPAQREGFVGFLSAIAADLGGAVADIVRPEDGRQSLELVAAIYDAARNDVVVSLPLDASHPLYGGWAPR